jgi:hypothetical protein
MWFLHRITVRSRSRNEQYDFGAHAFSAPHIELCVDPLRSLAHTLQAEMLRS